MEILRYSRDVWGKTVLEGMSWDLFWPFVGSGVAFILFHIVYMKMVTAKAKGHG
jgi:hypothetical protein